MTAAADYALDQVIVARQRDLDALEKRVARLEQQVEFLAVAYAELETKEVLAIMREEIEATG